MDAEELDADWRELSVEDCHGVQRDGGRCVVDVEGRFVMIIRLGKKLHAMDANCYHAGGPLLGADIEDTDKGLCVRCPWHHYDM
jgi:nitrite reductase/ring-hydroxylating ferredoxin subunit